MMSIDDLCRMACHEANVLDQDGTTAPIIRRLVEVIRELNAERPPPGTEPVESEKLTRAVINQSKLNEQMDEILRRVPVLHSLVASLVVERDAYLFALERIAPAPDDRSPDEPWSGKIATDVLARYPH